MIELRESVLQALVNEREFQDVKDIVKEVCEQDEDVLGVLITGSLTQRLRLNDPENPTYRNAYEAAYGRILNKARRRIFPSRTSDLDVWVMTADPYDTDRATEIKETIQDRSIDIITWLANNPDAHDQRWISKKSIAFDEFYKQPSMYSPRWLERNPKYPWRGGAIKRHITTQLETHMGDFIARINHNFEKRIPGEFIELRAYPPSVFNLRPEDVLIQGQIDKTPFPFPMDDLLRADDNCFVLYAKSSDIDGLIYPFNPEGPVLNKRLKDFVRRQV